MTDLDQRRREIMRHLDERYYAHYARLDAETEDERLHRLGQLTSRDYAARGTLAMGLDGHYLRRWPGDGEDVQGYDYRQ
jgi:hypothetical protein